MNNRPSRLKTCLVLYVACAILSFGPIAVDMRDATPTGPNRAERQGYGMALGCVIAGVWPLYWSYRIADLR